MLLTEEQARKKWCPMAKVVSDNNAGSMNRHFTEGIADTACLCLASDCMMWREARSEYKNLPAEGYCGLAGKIKE